MAKTKFGMVGGNITSVTPSGGNIEITYDIHKMFEKCYVDKLTKVNQEVRLKLELKWYICFRILFYLDQLHDFVENNKTPFNKKVLEYSIWIQFHDEIQGILKKVYIDFENRLNNNENLNHLYFEYINDLFNVSKTNENGSKCDENYLLTGMFTNTVPSYQGFFGYYNDNNSNIFFPVKHLTTNMYIYAECAFNIMGLRKTSTPKFQASMVAKEKFSFLNYPSTLLKMIYYNCHNIQFDTFKNDEFNKHINYFDKDLYVFVDALQSSSKLGPLNEYNLALNNYANYNIPPNLRTYKTPADIVDGASGNNIYNLIKKKHEFDEELKNLKFIQTKINTESKPYKLPGKKIITKKKDFINKTKSELKVIVDDVDKTIDSLKNEIKNLKNKTENEIKNLENEKSEFEENIEILEKNREKKYIKELIGKNYKLILNYSFNGDTHEMMNIDYIYNSKMYDLKVNMFFNNTNTRSFNDSNGKITTSGIESELNKINITQPPQVNVSKKRRIQFGSPRIRPVPGIFNESGKHKDNDLDYYNKIKNNLPINKASMYVSIMANKTILDISKSLFTLYTVENVIPKTRDFNYYTAYTDRIGGLISASIGTSTILAVGGDLLNYEFISFLGTKSKYPNSFITPEESQKDDWFKDQGVFMEKTNEDLDDLDTNPFMNPPMNQLKRKTTGFGKKTVRKDHELEYLLKQLKVSISK